MKKNQEKHSNFVRITPLIFITSLVFAIILAPPVLIVITLFLLYKQIIGLILKLRYSSKFLGFAEGADVTHLLEHPSKGVIDGMAIVEHDSDLNDRPAAEIIKEECYRAFFSQPELLPKNHTIFKKFMGYSYRLKTTVKPEECIKDMKIFNAKGARLNEETFYKHFSDICSAPLPRNETILWEMFFGYEHLDWLSTSDNPKKKLYPVFMRTHHALADGVSLMKFIHGRIGSAYKDNSQSIECYDGCTLDSNANYSTMDGKNKERQQNGSTKTKPSLNLVKKIKNLLQNLLFYLYVFALFPATLFIQLMIRAKDNNILHGPELSGKRVFAFACEKGTEYTEKVKKIRKALPGSAFSDIIYTAYSASLEDFYRKKTTNIPNFVCSVTPALPGSLELRTLVPGRVAEGGLHFNNSFSLLLRSIPVLVSEKYEKPLTQRYKWIKEETDELKKSVDYYVNLFMMTYIFPIVPQPIMHLIPKMMHYTTFVSCIAGPCHTYLGNLLLKHLVFYVPSNTKLGTSFSTLTYGGSLHVMFCADKVLISDQKDAQGIVDRIYKYIDLFEKEIVDTVC